MPCTQCKESYRDSYNVTVDTLKRENPTLSEHDMRVRAALRFRPIFHAMEVASSIEGAGKEEYENGEFALTPDGEMYFLNTGEKAEQLHINQLRSSELKNNPAEYSVTDHQTSKLIQHAFVNVATVVRTSFARDGQDNRDVLEYRYDKLTNRGVIKVINTAKAGLKHDFDSIKEITRQGSQDLTEVAPLEKVFIFTDIHLQQDNARSAVHVGERRPGGMTMSLSQKDSPLLQRFRDGQQSQKDSFEGHSIKTAERASIRTRGSLTQVVDTTGYAMRGLLRDTDETIKGVSSFIKNKNVQRDAKDRISGLPVVREVRRLFGKDDMKDHRSLITADRFTLEKIREKPVGVVEVIERRHSEMWRSATLLGLIAETGVVIHVAPVILVRLAEKLPAPVRSLEKSVRRHKKKELRSRNYEVRKKKREARRSDERVESLGKVKERKTRKKRRKVYMEIPTGSRIYTFRERGGRKDRRRRRAGNKEKTVKKIAVAHRLTVFDSKKVERQKRMRMRGAASRVEWIVEFKRLSKGDIKLYRLIKRFARRMEQKRKESRRMIRETMKPDRVVEKRVREENRREAYLQQSRKETKAAVNSFLFAFVFWLLLQSTEKRVQTHMTEKPFASLKDNDVSEYRTIQQTQKQEGLVVRKPAQWTLLSIIWYLAIVREGGKQHASSIKHQVSSKKNKKKKYAIKKQIFFPKHAVIFAFNS